LIFMDLKEMRKRIKEELGLKDLNSGVFDGEWVSNPKGKKYDLFSPIDGEFIGSVLTASKEDYENVVKKAEMPMRNGYPLHHQKGES